ncbi:zinc finger protein [Trichonephila inaurata madagascariensis]|uniref:Zinc finger protein n=1 Tax=Trichonephila inaurata madagascariensis TaxID=2747483 RepID=A0A8X7BVE7_9ARAC|nr:zinc finger protein [Trichonephila inaurata madagascariensis]
MWIFPNAFNSYKSSNEGNILVNEDQNNCMLTDTLEEDISQILDFLKSNENLFYKESQNEKPALLPDFHNIEYCDHDQRSTCQKKLESNLNQRSTSIGVGQISGNNAQSNSNPPSLPPELSSFPFSISEKGQYFNTNQQPASVKCSKMEHDNNEMNPHVEANEPAVRYENEPEIL